MHSRLQVLVEFQTTTGPLPVFVPCCCLEELASYRSRSPKYDGPPRSLVTLIIRTSGCDDRSEGEHREVRRRTAACDGGHMKARYDPAVTAPDRKLLDAIRQETW